MMNPKIYFQRGYEKLNALFGQGLVISMGIIFFIALLIAVSFFTFFNSAAPTTLTIASGPEGSSFRKTAEKYKKILAREGVTLIILPSEGAHDNYKKLTNPKIKVDVGFVLAGEVTPEEAEAADLMSLGSLSYQPLMVFYRGAKRELLSDFKGQKINIGLDGSGANVLARTLLKANGFDEKDNTQLIANMPPADSAKALLDGQIDAMFVMSDSTSTDIMRQLLRTPEIHLLDFSQANAYSRRFQYLSKIELPKGGLDFGKDIPAENINLIGPTVELVARETLHPALSDILLEAAREVHSTPSLFRKRNEFPAPLEHEFRISPDAARYYASGKSFLYRTFPFWLASLIARFFAVVVPIALLIIPAVKLAPAIYRWRIESRIYRWYRVLLELERDALKADADEEKRKELLRQLEHIENAVNKIVVPAAFGDLFYGLRGHINFVREKLSNGLIETKDAVGAST